MKKIVFTLALVLAGFFSVEAQKEVSGVKIANTLSIENQNLVLNGAGIREKLWIDLYVAALYLPKKNSNATEIITGNEAAAVELTIVSSLITSTKMTEAVNDGFEKATGGKTQAIKSEIESFISLFKEEIKKGDVFTLVNVPSKGVVVFKNKTQKGIIKGTAFKKALFGIWLSNTPADKKLKDKMLGK